MSTRFALVRGPRETVERYLPSNYRVLAEREDGEVLVGGEDRAGWTLDGYVIPRLASGLYAAREVPVAYRCPECFTVWTTEDDPNEWAYGHDCEV